MAGGSSLPNPYLSMPVLVITPLWYAGLMDFSNISLRAVCILRKVSSRSFPYFHFLFFGSLVGVSDGGCRCNKIIPYVHWILSFSC